MIIDTHAYALDEAFLTELCRTPRLGLSADRDATGRFRVRRNGGPAVLLDDDLSSIPQDWRVVAAPGRPAVNRAAASLCVLAVNSGRRCICVRSMSAVSG
jgi:hypothetical protein